PCVIIAAIPKCGRVFDHRDHKERKEAANLRLICRFFVFSVLFAVECVLHLELLPRGFDAGHWYQYNRCTT
ncbi:MAG: hypothetical protein WAV66_19240, partial [Anaerolineae bacterium]